MQWESRPPPALPPHATASQAGQPFSPGDLSVTLLPAPCPPPRRQRMQSGPSLPPNWLTVPPGAPPGPGVLRSPFSGEAGPHDRVSTVKGPCCLLAFLPCPQSLTQPSSQWMPSKESQLPPRRHGHVHLPHRFHLNMLSWACLSPSCGLLDGSPVLVVAHTECPVTLAAVTAQPGPGLALPQGPASQGPL